MDFPLEAYKNFGLIGFGIFWITTVVMIRLLRGDKTKSISSHAASAKKVSMVFGLVSALSAIVLILFFMKWFTPTFQLGTIFNLLVIGMLILFGIAGIVPDKKGIKHTVHIWSAVVASVLLLPAMTLIIGSNQISQVARIFTAIALVAMVFIGYQLIKRNRNNSRLLMYEALYFLCFDLSILVVTYVR